MLLTRLALVSLLLCGTLPCLAQDGTAIRVVPPSTISQPPQSSPFTIFTIPLPRSLVKTDHRKLESALSSGVTCYSIRDYRFAADSKSAMPKLKRYSTCESASLFQMREVTIAPLR